MTSRKAVITTLAISALLVLASCGGSAGGPGSVSISGPCADAFKSAVNPIGGGNGPDSLDQAVRDCSSIAEWEAAWTTYPNAHGSAIVARTFLGQRCLEGTLVDRPLCRAVYPSPPPTY